MKYADSQPHLAPGREAEELRGRLLHEVVAFDPELAREGDLPRPGRGVLRVVGDVHLLDLALGVVLDDHLEGIEDPEAPMGRPIEHGAHRVLQLADLDDRVRLRHADHGGEVADPFGREAAPAQARDRRHPGVVPAAHVPFVDQAQEDPLGEDGVGEVEAGELVLARDRRHRKVLDEPVVEGPVDLELEGADRVGDALDGVGLAVGEVVGRVDAPGVAGAGMRGVHDPVENGVAQVDVWRGHVDPRSQDSRPVGELAGPHPLEQVAGSPRPTGRARGCSGRAR